MTYKKKVDRQLMGEDKIKIRKNILEIENDADDGWLVIKSKRSFDLFDIPLKQRRVPSSAISFNNNGIPTDRKFHEKFWKTDVELGWSPLSCPPMTQRMMIEKFLFKDYPVLESIIMRIFDEIEAISYGPSDKVTNFDEASDLFVKREDFNRLKHAWAYPTRSPTLTEEGDTKRHIRKQREIDKKISDGMG